MKTTPARRNQDLAPLTASAGIERVTCLCAAHSANPIRSRGVLEQAYIAAKTEAQRMNKSFTASAYRETADDAFQAWQDSVAIAETYETEAERILDSLEKE